MGNSSSIEQVVAEAKDDSSVKELYDLSIEDLSLGVLQDKLQLYQLLELGHYEDFEVVLCKPSLFLRACTNKKITLEVIEYLLDISSSRLPENK